jgi:hypothetical protein
LRFEALDALSAIRNLLVHRAGIVDRTYEKKTKYLKIPVAPIGSPIFLDGDIVSKIMATISVISMKLVTGVDLWVAEN